VKSCQTLGATTPKLSHGGSFGAALTDQVAGSRLKKLAGGNLNLKFPSNLKYHLPNFCTESTTCTSENQYNR